MVQAALSQADGGRYRGSLIQSASFASRSLSRKGDNDAWRLLWRASPLCIPLKLDDFSRSRREPSRREAC